MMRWLWMLVEGFAWDLLIDAPTSTSAINPSPRKSISAAKPTPGREEVRASPLLAILVNLFYGEVI
jgi:hypothetical protein